jgi:hypothetical protein
MGKRKQRSKRSHRDVWQGELTLSLHRIGVATRVNPTKSYAESDSADLIAYRGGRVVAIEVKSALDGSAFNLCAPDSGNGWREGQRRWAFWCRNFLHTEYFIAVFYETEHSPWRAKRTCFLVPYPAILEAFQKVSPYQKSLPYFATAGYKQELQDGRIDARNLWSEYELRWSGKSVWEIPERHIIRDILLTKPLPLAQAQELELQWA